MDERWQFDIHLSQTRLQKGGCGGRIPTFQEESMFRCPSVSTHATKRAGGQKQFVRSYPSTVYVRTCSPSISTATKRAHRSGDSATHAPTVSGSARSPVRCRAARNLHLRWREPSFPLSSFLRGVYPLDAVSDPRVIAVTVANDGGEQLSSSSSTNRRSVPCLGEPIRVDKCGLRQHPSLDCMHQRRYQQRNNPPCYVRAYNTKIYIIARYCMSPHVHQRRVATSSGALSCFVFRHVVVPTCKAHHCWCRGVRRGNLGEA